MNSPAASIIDLYRRHAIAWTTARGTRLIEGIWLDRFSSLLPRQASVLDIGCGSGLPIARHLVAHGTEVTGIDSAPEMILLFRENLPDQPHHVADMRTLELGRRFEGLIGWDSFFHLPQDEQRRMFPIFRSHAAQRAALMFTSGPSHSEAIGTLEGEPLYHASLDPSEYRELLDAHGFEVIRHVVEDPECGGHTVWLARLR
jgi:SAM-dependent methyltransferase